MKILSPLDNIDDVAALAQAGAGEFYCGVLEENWYEKYPVISINRRPAGKGHFRQFSDFRRAVEKAHEHSIPVFLTINEHYYVQAQYPLIQTYVDAALEAEVDALIVSDVGLIAWLQKHNYDIPLHISTGGTVFNRRSMAFYRDMGIKNITFPRHLDIDELRELTSAMPDMDTTVFVFNSRCINVDGYCTFQHGLANKEILPMYRNACMLPFEMQVYAEGPKPPGPAYPDYARIVVRQKTWERVHVDDHPCGACALYDFREMGIGSVKIVGRGNPLERKVRDVAFLRHLIDDIANGQTGRDAFRRQARLRYRETYKRPCRMPTCYFPSVMCE